MTVMIFESDVNDGDIKWEDMSNYGGQREIFIDEFQYRVQ
jgi:hypothetical protein